MSGNAIEKRPWYREPMVWLMIALPAAAVVAGLSTVVIAVRASGDDAVPESVRRTAQMQVADMAADQAAAKRQLSATLRIDRATGALRVSIAGDSVADQRVVLHFVHATNGAHDAITTLVQSGDSWLGRTDAPLDHAWGLLLTALDDSWRLQGRLLTEQDAALLEPALLGD